MIAIIDYKSGNIASVKNALERLGQACVVTSDPKEIVSARGVIFPGQGRAGTALAELQKTGIDALIPKLAKPFLGICLGMQILASYSAEDETKCLRVFQGECRAFPQTLKTPHLGWNKVFLLKDSPLAVGIQNGSYFYFAHSYYVDAPKKYVVGKTSCGFEFSSIIQKDNFFGVQFHPEKSGDEGLRVLNNFCGLCS